MFAKAQTKCMALIILTAYLFALFGSPPVSYADEKSSKAKSETERWRRNNRLAGESLSTEFKIILVATGILLVVAVIHKIAKADGDEPKSEVQKTSETQVDSSQVFFVQRQPQKHEQKLSPYLLGRKPLIPSEN